MFFPYQCQKCGKKFDGEYPVGKAPRVSPCPITSCKGKGKRIYEGLSIGVKIGADFARTTTFGEQMKNRNLAAAKRMKGNRPPVRPIAHDFGHGDVREIKAK